MILFKNLSRILVGLVFIFSAALKLYSIDFFEVYVFSFQWFNFDTASVLARLLVGFEFFIGIALISKIQARRISILTLLILVSFSIFLGVLALRGSTENCHCMGNFVHLSPMQSILKNAVLVLLLIFSQTPQEFRIRFPKTILGILLIISIVSPFIVSPPDFIYKPKTSHAFHQAEMQEVLKTHPQFQNIVTGKKIVCFLGTSCRFCQLTAEKLAVVRQRHHISANSFLYVYWGNNESVTKFRQEHKAQDVPFTTLDTRTFMDITHGSLPVIVCWEDNKIIKTFKYRDMDEEWISSFWK